MTPAAFSTSMQLLFSARVSVRYRSSHFWIIPYGSSATSAVPVALLVVPLCLATPLPLPTYIHTLPFHVPRQTPRVRTHPRTRRRCSKRGGKGKNLLPAEQRTLISLPGLLPSPVGTAWICRSPPLLLFWCTHCSEGANTFSHLCCLLADEHHAAERPHRRVHRLPPIAFIVLLAAKHRGREGCAAATPLARYTTLYWHAAFRWQQHLRVATPANHADVLACLLGLSCGRMPFITPWFVRGEEGV